MVNSLISTAPRQPAGASKRTTQPVSITSAGCSTAGMVNPGTDSSPTTWSGTVVAGCRIGGIVTSGSFSICLPGPGAQTAGAVVGGDREQDAPRRGVGVHDVPVSREPLDTGQRAEVGQTLRPVVARAKREALHQQFADGVQIVVCDLPDHITSPPATGTLAPCR